MSVRRKSQTHCLKIIGLGLSIISDLFAFEVSEEILAFNGLTAVGSDPVNTFEKLKTILQVEKLIMVDRGTS